jgi:Uma2 family endonuclease
MSIAVRQYVTPQEYLEFERVAETKSEYFNGEIFAMAGASLQHNRITRNLTLALASQLRGNPCEAFSADMRVRVPATGLYTYPDVVVGCGELQLEDQHFDTLLNPTLIIEVLSGSTAHYDRGEKFAQYRRLESFREYVLVSQDRCRVERFVRRGDEWTLTEFSDPQVSVVLESIGCTLSLAEVYERVEFPADVPLR